MSYKLEITQEGNRYKVVIDSDRVIYIDDLKDLESAVCHSFSSEK